MTPPVLLPLRIETRFRPANGPPTELRVRVIPDEPWFDDHAPTPSEEELRELQAWEEAKARVASLERQLEAATTHAERVSLAGQLETARGRQRGTWKRLVDHRGRGRARWLAENGSAQTGRPRDRGQWRRVVGLPPLLEVWLVTAGDGEPEPGPRLILRPDATQIDLTLPMGGADTSERWWSSFDEAVRVGLAGTIRLTDADRARMPFEALVVVGLGDDTSAALFAGHRDAGKLAVLECGQPTNTVAGGETPVRDTDDTSEPAPTAAPAAPVRDLSRLLFGTSDALDAVPRPADTQEVQHAVVQALWPVLWGHTLADFWVTGTALRDIGPWAMRAVAPEGSLPPIRIGDQPYGVLPVTVLASYETGSAWAEPVQVAEHLVPRLVQARRTWLEAAANEGTVAGADAARLLDLAGHTPISTEIRWRKMFPYDLLLGDLRDRRLPADHVGDWHDLTAELATFGLAPWRRLASVYGTRSIDMPLVVPAGATPAATGDALGALLEPLVGRWAPDELNDAETLITRMGTDASVLLQLARASLLLALAEAGRVHLGEPIPTLDNVLQLRESKMVRWIANAPAPAPAGAPSVLRLVIEGLQALQSAVQNHDATVDRTLRGALDCASHRLDAWLTAPAVHRMRAALEASPSEPARLGAYGWVDRLGAGGGGPTAGGAILAPSIEQAKTAAILRDRHVREGGSSRWTMNVTSRRARAARKLGDAVQCGLHPAIALGLEVEGLIDNPVRIQSLRSRFPARRDDGGRRVCDGLKVLERARTESNLWEDVEGVAITARLREQLSEVVDVYADLLVAQSVQLVAEGRGAVAGAALDAAAGLAIPPSLEVLSAPTAAHHLQTVVVAALPRSAVPPMPTARPAERVDRHVAELVDQRYRSADWRWTFRGTASTGSEAAEVTLAAMGLLPSDAACLSGAMLETIARTLAVEALAPRLGVPAPALSVAIEAAPGREVREALGRFLRGLGRRPLTAADMTGGAAEYAADPAAVGATMDVARDLLRRLIDVAAQLDRFLTELRASAPISDAQLRACRQWGVGAGDARGQASYIRILAQRLHAVEARLAEVAEATEGDGAPPLERASAWDLSTLPAARVDRMLARLSLPDLSELLLGMVAAEGDMALTASPHVDPSSRLLGLAAGTSAETLKDWLSTTAAVRPALANAEAALLEAELTGGSAPSLTSTNPDDPWQLIAPSPSPDSPDGPGQPRLNPPPMILCLAHAGVDPTTDDAVFSLVDRFAESVPEPKRPPAIAFGFDAPAARAPQALLVAVPSGPERTWTPTGRQLLDIVLEARALARVRTVRPTNVGITGLASFLPTAMAPQHGPAAVRLESTDPEA